LALLGAAVLLMGCAEDLASPADRAQPGFENDPVVIMAGAPITGITLTQLGIPPGGQFARPYAISDGGLIVGQARFAGQQFATAFVYSGTFLNISPAGTAGGYADGVNNTGQVAGFNATPLSVPFRWTSGTGLVALRLTSPGAKIRAINASGVVVGQCTVAGRPNRACLWTSPTALPIDLGTLALAPNGPDPASVASEATGINTQGDVVGYSRETDRITGVLYTSAFFKPQSGAMVRIGNLSGDLCSWATGINDQRQVIGFSARGNPTVCNIATLIESQQPRDGQHGFIWSPGVPIRMVAQLPGGGNLLPRGINNAGIVVGYGLARIPGSPTSTFVMRPYVLAPNDIPRDLGTHAGGAGTGWAAAINNQNQVAGSSRLANQQEQAVRWNLQFTSSPANRAPTANAGPGASGNEGSAVAFNGSASTDPDGNPLTYTWSFGDGTSGSGATPAHVYADNGSYTVQLTVRDPSGATSSATTVANIANVAPTVNAGPDAAINLGASFTLSGSFSDAGTADSPWSFSINWGDGSPATSGTATPSSPISASHAYAASGNYTVVLRVTDKDGASGTDQATVGVNVSGANSPPIAGTDQVTTTMNRPITINVLANDRDPNGDPLTILSVTRPEFGTPVINPNGTITFTPRPGFVGRPIFYYTIGDGRGGTARGQVIVFVVPGSGGGR
jgi:PKD repeat protein